MVTLEMRAKEKEGEIVLLTGRVELQEAELRSECHMYKWQRPILSAPCHSLVFQQALGSTICTVLNSSHCTKCTRLHVSH